MLIFLISFSLSWNFNKFEHYYYNNSYNGDSLYMENFLLYSMNDLFNDGINITTFMNLFKGIPSFDTLYEEKLNLLTDQNLRIFPKYFKFSSYLDLSQTLTSIPEVYELILQYRSQYAKYKSFIELFGQKICNNFDLDYKKVKKLIDYVLINEENDGIVIEKIFKILQIPTNWVPKVSKILSRYDDIETISDLLSKLNVLPQYYDFIEKVNQLKIPKDINIKFFSITKIIDCQTSFVVLLNAVDSKVREILNEIKPLLPRYKPFNFQFLIENAPKYIKGIEMYMKLMGYKTPIYVTNIFKEKVPLKNVVENLTKLHKTFKNIRYSTNLKLFFDYLNIERFWFPFRDIVYHISRDDSLCDFFEFNTKKCNKLFKLITEKSKFFVSKSSFAKSMPNYVTEFYIPLLNSLSLKISDFLSLMYKLSLNNEKVNDVNFTNFVNSIGRLFESIVKYIERIDTKQFLLNSTRANFVCDLLKNNGCFELLIDPRFNIIVEMLKSGAKSYVNERTTIATVTKSIQPTSFLNVYQTFLKLSEVKSLKISRLANAICYDEDSSKENINDIFPIKTIMKNLNRCEVLVNEMNNNVLYIESLSNCIGIEKEKLKDFLSKYLNSCISFYVGTIIGATRSSMPKHNNDKLISKM